jgi:hypothetical protein
MSDTPDNNPPSAAVASDAPATTPVTDTPSAAGQRADSQPNLQPNPQSSQQPDSPRVAPAPYVPPAARTEFGRESTPAYQMAGDTPWKHMWRVFSARLESLSDQAGRRLTQRTLKIGVSARIFHPEAGARGLQGKTLQYLEESIAQ